jgi:predicted transposase YdaD
MQTLAEHWESQGMRKGRVEGRVAGRVEGVRRVLLLTLTKRFKKVPAKVKTRIDAASLATLERWCEHAIDAPSLDDVFARGPRG